MPKGKYMKHFYQRLCAGLLLASASVMSWAASEDPLIGKWKTIDDRSGYSRADVEIKKKPDGTYEGIIVETRSLPGSEKMIICTQCPGQLKDKPFLGLPFVWGFKASPSSSNEYIDGRVLDPIGGKIYKAKARLSSSGRHLTIRGYIGVSVIGRSVTWVKY